MEADVWLINGTLFVSDKQIYTDLSSDLVSKLNYPFKVGHELGALTESRTFDSLYVEPLVKIIEGQNPRNQFTLDQPNTKYAMPFRINTM